MTLDVPIGLSTRKLAEHCSVRMAGYVDQGQQRHHDAQADPLQHAQREFASDDNHGELTLGVLEGIALGVVVSLLTLIYVTSHPHGAVLGQLPGTEAYRNVQRHPEAITFPGLLILRIGGDLFFASVGHVCQALKASLAARPDVKRVLLDLGPVNFIDITASDELLSLIKELRSRGI